MSLLVRNPSLALAPAEDGYLAYDLHTGRLHRLNPAAALVLELGDGTRDAESLCAGLRVLDPLLDKAACLHWIEQSRREQLFVFLNAGADAPALPDRREFLSEARALRDQGLVLAAFVCQWHATASFPPDTRDWIFLGELAHIIGRRGDAREAYERYLEQDPDNAEVAHILTALRDDPVPARAPDRSVEQLYARFAEFYESNMCGDLGYEAPQLLADAVGARIGDAGDLKVLDLGCGTGLSGRAFRARARDLTGVDLSPEMAAHARAAGVYDVLEVAEIGSWLGARSARPSNPSNRYDLIVACDSLIYFGDLAQVVGSAAGLLRPGGWLAFTLELSAGSPVRLTDSGRYAHSPAHVRQVAAAAGLDVDTLSEGRLRYEYGDEVRGLVVVLRRAGTHGGADLQVGSSLPA